MTDNPEPQLEEVQQRDFSYPAVLVKPDGPVTTHELPARVSTVSDFQLTAAWQMVLPEDPKRKRLVLISDTAFTVSHNNHGGGKWPANVPLDWRNTSAIFAKVDAGTALVTVIPEEWAD